MDTLPIIDISGLRAPERERRLAVAAQLGQACRGPGFFYATGHGVPAALRQAVFAAAQRFFALPEAQKQAVSVKRSPHNRGYIGFGDERLDEHAVPDDKEAFNIGLELAADDPELLARAPFRGPNLWPDLPRWQDRSWREDMLDYYAACHGVLEQIHRGFALDLGLDEDFFAAALDRSLSVLRLLHYPAAPAGTKSLGAGQHTDYGNLTLLATDGVAGLQLRPRGGDWIDAPHLEGAFVCNIADCLMRWTNDVYVSTPHRVLRPVAERYSVAFFGDSNPHAVVAAIPTCVPAGAAPRYPPITCGAYLQQRLDATYDHLKEAAS